MAHELAKFLLEHAGSVVERNEAVRTALFMGMPLHEIEEYLDWLDSVRGPLKAADIPESREPEPGKNPPKS